jgi:hypothetical protein
MASGKPVDYVGNITPIASYESYKDQLWISNKTILESSRSELMHTMLHELIHPNEAFDARNARFYGGPEQMLGVANHVICIANQSLRTGVYLDGYHADLGHLLLEGEIDEQQFIRETQAILIQMYVFSRGVKSATFYDADDKPQVTTFKKGQEDWYLMTKEAEIVEALRAEGQESEFVPLLTPRGSAELKGAEAIFAALLPENKRKLHKVRRHADMLNKIYGGNEPLIRRPKGKGRQAPKGTDIVYKEKRDF